MENIPTRNNNPGDIRDTTTGAYKTYGSPQEGFDALKNDLNIKISGKSKTGITPDSSLSDFASIYAPDSDGNNSAKYASDLASQLGVSTDTPISALANRQDDFANAIAKNEGYHGQQVAGMEASVDPATPITDTNQTAQPIDSYTDSSGKTLNKQQLTENINYMDSQGFSQEDIQKYVDGFKKNTSSPTNPAASIASGTQDTTTPAPQQSFGQKALNFIGSLTGTEGAGQDIAGAIQGGQGVQDYTDVMKSWSDVADKLQQKIQSMDQAGQDTTKLKTALQQHLQSMPKASDFIPGAVDKTPAQVMGDFGQLGLGVAASAIPGAGSIGGRILGAAGVGAASGALNAVSSGSTDAGEIGKEAAIGAGIGGATGGLVEGAGAAFRTMFSPGKTAEELTALARDPSFTEADAAKLAPKEQIKYYQAKGLDATEAAAAERTNIDTQLRTDKDTLTSQIIDQGKATGEAAKTQAQALIQPAKQLITDMSGQYATLSQEAIDKAVAAGFSKEIPATEISNQIDGKFEIDKNLGESIKQDLGIKPEQTPEIDEKTGEPVPQEEAKPITTDQILKTAKGYMQQISAASKGGSKVFSAGEYQLMQKYSTLMEILGDNGVDMKEANAFWKEWAPMRKKIVTQIRPFDTADSMGIQKQPFSKTLITANAKATTPLQNDSKIAAQDFITKLEKALKVEPGTIGADVKSQLEGLEKTKLDKINIQQVAADAKKALAKEVRATRRSIGDAKFNASTAADKRIAVKKAVLTALKYAGFGYVGLEGVKKLIP